MKKIDIDTVNNTINVNQPKNIVKTKNISKNSNDHHHNGTNEINRVLNELFNFRPTKRRDHIDDMIKIYDLLGRPCQNPKIIHIAGTNGKGSTASFIENILFEAGYSVCKFTSPHIIKYNERIIFNKEMIPDNEIIENYKIVMETANAYNADLILNGDESLVRNLNFFEITFFIALLYFHKKNADFVILETGLGGRVDATNTIDSNISVITNISFDHTAILGNSLKEIAYEKCAIIKNNELCIFSQNLNELTEAVNKRTSNSFNVLNEYSDIKIHLDKENYHTIISFYDTSSSSNPENSALNNGFDSGFENKYQNGFQKGLNNGIENKNFSIPLFGKFQGYNFLLAYKIAKIYNIEDEIIQKGILNTYWPARFEFFKTNPPVILDAAHNDDSIKKLSENLNELYKKNEVIIITSLLETKDFKSVFSQLEEISDKIFITSLKDVTYGLTSQEIKDKMLSLNIPVQNIVFEDDILIAYETALKMINSDSEEKASKYKAIVICGSFYEISKFKKLIDNTF